ncbi:putative X-Pro dipeptidyl-peptidase [Secundilactobacillus oryzae JCM 18671]|uniref:Putative X-Pro dipeptidyl-peptidase n=2 Tax=Secundilactobacillus oryzae TaxID=1202668 RepID=A0A081BKA6_9LACO|nr:putative X-Pro dipeptidyl-peptidase [Secundilactobacillus oryzae JCM 18671]
MIMVLERRRHYPKGMRKIILGPWLHSGNAQYDLGPVHLGENALRFDIDLQHFRWFDHFLNGIDNGIENESVVDYYTLNTDEWRHAESFPPKSVETKWYLDAKTKGFTVKNPERISFLDFDYDPDNPASHLIDVSANELEFPNDYHDVETREDVVSFTSSMLQEPLTITGWFKIQFYASSSAVNTDWVIRLTDVTPEGESINIADNVVNAMFRDDIRYPQPLASGEVYRFEIESQKTSIQLPEGHRLRLDITSSAENLVFPNSNTIEGADGTETVVAHQKIYTGGQYPSKLQFTED